MIDTQRIRDALRVYICTELLRRPDYPLEDDEPLMTGGLIDSFSVVHISVFIEMQFQVFIPDTELTVENMDTLTLIASQVLRFGVKK